MFSVNQQRLFTSLALCGLVVLGYFAFGFATPITSKKQVVNPDGLPPLSDLFMAGTIAYFYIFLKSAIEFLVTPCTAIMKIQKKWDKNELEHRKTRFCNNIYYAIVYTIQTIVGWYILKDKIWSPSWYVPFAHGDATHCAIDNLNHKIEPDVKIYYMLQLGFTMSSLYDVLIAKKHRHDFFEMMLHHFVTIFLIVFSYFIGFTRIGTLVLIVHDPVDIFAFGARTLADSIYENTLGALAFFGLVLSWFFFRLVAYPFSVIYAAIFTFKGLVDDLQAYSLHIFFVGLLSTLLVLHVYWFCHFPKFIIAGIKGNMKSEEVNDDDADKED